MSTKSEDDCVARLENGTSSVANKSTIISGKESDGSRLHDYRSPPPPSDNDDIDYFIPERSYSSGEYVTEDEESQTRNKLDAYERRVLKRRQTNETVELLHFSPSLQVNMVIATDGDVPENEPYLMAFRPKRGAPSDVSGALLQALRGGPIGVYNVLESNLRILEWYDGSRTVMVGDEHYMIVKDELVSDFYLLHKGEDVQTFEASCDESQSKIEIRVKE